MNLSIIIPLWNGASVITGCLQALRESKVEDALEIICVDNASEDGSAAIVKDQFPEVKILAMPVNLGFAGGVNAGIDAAGGDVFILLNQDCAVFADWLSSMVEAIRSYPGLGLFGSTIYNPDGSLNHTGATIHRPDAVGVHFHELNSDQPKVVDYVTGAALAIPRRTWEIVGRFDEGFYPAYYEDCDYCFRALNKGLASAWVPGAKVTHLFSNRSWQKDPIRFTTNSFCNRYRFVCKHYTGDEIIVFFQNELNQLDGLRYLDHVVGRMIAGRYVLRNLEEILARRQLDLGETASSSQMLEMRLGLSNVIRKSYLAANQLLLSVLQESPKLDWGLNPNPPAAAKPTPPSIIPQLMVDQPDILPEKQSVPEQIPPDARKSSAFRKRIAAWLFRQLPDLRWTPNILSLEAKWDKMTQQLAQQNLMISSLQDQINQLNQLGQQYATLESLKDQQNQIIRMQGELSGIAQITERLRLLEILAEYDNR